MELYNQFLFVLDNNFRINAMNDPLCFTNGEYASMNKNVSFGLNDVNLRAIETLYSTNQDKFVREQAIKSIDIKFGYSINTNNYFLSKKVC